MTELTVDERIEARFTAHLMGEAFRCGLIEPDEINDFTTRFADTAAGRRARALIAIDEHYAALRAEARRPVVKLLDWLTRRRRE